MSEDQTAFDDFDRAAGTRETGQKEQCCHSYVKRLQNLDQKSGPKLQDEQLSSTAIFQSLRRQLNEVQEGREKRASERVSGGGNCLCRK